MDSSDRAVQLLKEATDDRQRFVALAKDAAAEAIEMQYPRLRAFALMAQKSRVGLVLRVNFDFARTNGGVTIEAEATPPPVVERVERRLPAPTRRQRKPAAAA
jgi:hypothetical protein